MNGKTSSRQSRWYHQNKEKVAERNKKKYWANPNKARKKAAEYQKKRRNGPKAREIRQKDMLRYAKRRAKQKGREFELDLDDVTIPDVCPVLGIPLDPREGPRRDNTPTLDRIDNDLGYVKENVWVISWKANSMKSKHCWKDLVRLGEALKSKMKDQI